MEKIIVKELSKEFETLELLPVGDIHYGARNCNEEMFNAFTRYVLEAENRYVILNGDIINNNVVGSVGSPFEDKMSPREQKKQMIHLLRPIRERIICAISGNHEQRTKKTNDDNPLEDIADTLDLEYSEYDAFMKIKFGKMKGREGQKVCYTVFATHGYGGGRLPGSSLNNIEKLTLNCFADVYIMNHVHKKMSYKANYRMPDLYNNVVRDVEMLYVISSSFQDYDGYAKRKQLRPSSLGVVPIILDGREKKATAVI